MPRGDGWAAARLTMNKQATTAAIKNNPRDIFIGINLQKQVFESWTDDSKSSYQLARKH
jgi:hypothetical protein